MLVPIEWLADGRVRFIDQTRLPREEAWVETSDYREVAQAIRRLQVRGAPLIGIAAAYGLALASRQIEAARMDGFLTGLRLAAAELTATRPTAVNLAWALRRLLARAERCATTMEAQKALLEEACAIHQEDIEGNRRIGAQGAELLPDGASVLTLCNTGSLATGGYGTALGVVRSAWAQGKLRHVFAMETRPLLQGARLTAWELERDGIPFTLAVDSAAGTLLRRGLAGVVVVGADRIAANGDVANKIGTYPLAVLARENGAPFYVAAPTSTVDLELASGETIPIEDRGPEEVTTLGGLELAPPGTGADNPAFDLTPNRYVTAVITERGVARPPYGDSLAHLCSKEVASRG